MSFAEQAIQDLYDNASLRESLTDDEAQLLYDWASAEIQRQEAASAGDEEAFEGRSKQVRRVMKQVNKFVEGREAADPDLLTEVLAKLVEDASALGYPISEEQQQAFLASQADLDHSAALGLLFALMPNSPLDDIDGV